MSAPAFKPGRWEYARYPDARGPLQKVVGIRDRSGGHYYLDLDCGHAEVVGHFTYRVGMFSHCHACGMRQIAEWTAKQKAVTP